MDTHFRQYLSLGSRVGEMGKDGGVAGTPLAVGFGRSLAQSDEDCEWRDRRDSNLTHHVVEPQ
ncbi:hypothetical protein OAO16_02445 [Opitutales bacterium]|nr:hypothetical protein [Opitutales bacterium]